MIWPKFWGMRVFGVGELRHLRKIRQIAGNATSTFGLGLMISSLLVQPLPAPEQPAEKPALTSAQGQERDQRAWNVPLSQDEKVVQLLNRVTFGPRPSDVERVQKMGLEAFLDQQLHPEKIDDSSVGTRIAQLPTLSMSAEELMENFPPPNKALKREARGQQAAGDVPGAKRFAAKGKGEARSDSAGETKMEMQASTQEVHGPQRIVTELAQEEVLRAVYSNRQLQEEMVQFWMNHFNIFAEKGVDKWMMTSFERDTIRPRALGKFDDLLLATAESPAMLFYLDNWMSTAPGSASAGNHKEGFRRSAPVGGRIIRPWGPFGAARPMSFASGTAAHSGSGGFQDPNARQKKGGLNENYGRELMELHTMGVDGGYTQQDVIEVARCLTGWTIDHPRRGGQFTFDPRMHDFGEKTVLGHKIPSGRGMEDGLQVIHLLAHHSSTAHFIALKLCRRFVADDPPQSLVDGASQTFLKTDGDIRVVLKTILTSSEFYSQAAYRAKMKSPVELVASSLRALGGDTDAGVPLLQLIARMGEPMFRYQAPTGFPDRASTWIDSSSLLMRMNFALLLATNRIHGTQVDWQGFGVAEDRSSAEAVIGKLDRQLLDGSLEPETRETILKQVDVPAPAQESRLPISSQPGKPGGADARPQTPDRFATVAALILASPEFQRR